jgi:aryl-alcohol dehydrogenase-like predicted oxidoreductase
MENTTRVLGRSGIEVSAVGFGCWAVGGEYHTPDGQPLGWGRVDDEESVRAIRRALDLGVTFFDTADSYGAGHSERVLGRALGKRRAEVVVATKWGFLFDEPTRTFTGGDDSVAYARRALTASLRAWTPTTSTCTSSTCPTPTSSRPCGCGSCARPSSARG